MGAGHGIGIKRNDYHRRNRKRNISMHSHSHGINVGSNQQDWMPRVPIDALIREAVARDAQQKNLLPHQIVVKTACVNYLRHCHTDYEAQLKGKGLAGDYKIRNYLATSEMIFNEIAATYPWLSDECERQLERRRAMAAKTKLVRKAELQAARVSWFNERHGNDSHNAPVLSTDNELTDDEYSAAMASTLKFQAVIFSPPFLSRDEIRARRFSNQYGEMNDRWWEWEKEKKARGEKFRWVA